jgi:ribosomal protein S18 acetylase RimI-like enzyme|tara:strand:- start:1916 stop:2419 length:504 start_codon:yes stop_codon:yes gene_type:complete
VIEKIFRSYLEIKSYKAFNEARKPSEDYSVELVNPKDFQLNKFFYKKIGKNCQWVDRLSWIDLKWINYVSDKNLFTYILKEKNELAGYYELLLSQNSLEAEIVYFGILEEYFGKRLGAYLLSEAIKSSFKMGSPRVWVHTCSFDHKNALGNYLSRGMKIFKSETLIR